jgi:ketosteroid isomerase-like protein
MKRLLLAASGAALAMALLRRLRGGHHDDDHEDEIQAYFDAWSEGDGETMRDLVSDDYQGHVRTLEGMDERDADQLVSVVESHAEAFSEVDYELHEVISQNGSVAVRATMHARHEETGQEGEIDGIAILRFDGDQIVEEWSSWDYPGLVEQLGLSDSN